MMKWTFLVGKFTSSDIMELCLEIGRPSVENALKKLCDDGIIEKHGRGVRFSILLKISINS